MKSFLEKYAKVIVGALNGFDRLCIRGTARRISSIQGLMSYLQYHKILLKDFGGWARGVTGRIRAASEEVAQRFGRPVEYLRSSSVDKEALARSIAARDGIDAGLICLFSVVEPCLTFDVRGNRSSKKLELVARERKCVWIYHYQIHPMFGFMHARIQTWLPFTIKMCINGREWLSRQMDAAGIGYVRRENCFADIEDIAAAQQLMDKQLKTDWSKVLGSIQNQISPAHSKLFSHYPLAYYWSVDESEWASDVMFKSHDDLSQLYRPLIKHGMDVFGSYEVMRFLGQNSKAVKKVHPLFTGQVVTDIKSRPEGIRIKHRVKRNHVKMYDKQGSVLRVETTINNTRDFKVYRRANDDPTKPYRWQLMRKGVADLHRRAQVSQASNSRYFGALSKVHVQTTVEQQLQPICRRVRWQGKSFRALNPWGDRDGALLSVISRGEFLINGLRNRDVLASLHPQAEELTDTERKRLRAKISRQLRLLRAHGLIRKVSKTHRYIITDKGKEITTAYLAVSDTKVSDLYKKAA